MAGVLPRSLRRASVAGTLATLVACTGAKPTTGQTAVAARLDDPMAVLAIGPAPDSFDVTFETSQGDFRLRVRRAWAPNGADRFYALVRRGYFDDQRFFRVRAGFIAQFGLHGDPRVIAAWKSQTMADDSARVTNRRGTLAYAFTTANTRSTQIFINLADNSRLDAEGFAPFGEIIRGVEVIDRLYAGYDETAGGGMRGGKQGAIEREGNAHLKRDFPRLDYIRRCRIVSG